MSSGGPRRGGSLRGSLPGWLGEVTAAGGIRRYVLGVIVSALLGLWATVLGGIEAVWSVWISLPRLISGQLALIGRPAWLLLDGIDAMQGAIESAAASAGLAGPLVAVIAWLVPVLILVAILNVLIGIAETYLPLSAIPILGRWFR
jgi:hypothetical protein